MSYGEDAPPSRHRAWHDDAAPEPYPWQRYGDGVSAQSLYAAPDPAAPTESAHTLAPHSPVPYPVEDHPVEDHQPSVHRAPPEWPLPLTPEPWSGSAGSAGSGAAGAAADGSSAGGRRAGRPARNRQRQPGAPRGGRAGRDLPAAIGVGVALVGTVLLSLSFRREAFLVVMMVAVGIGTWEMVRAIRPSGAHPPLVPLLAAGPVMVLLAWFGGAAALPLGLLAGAVAVLVWRLGEGTEGYQRDVTAATLVAVYVPFLASFAVLLAHPDDGFLRVLATLAGVVLSDTGGYVTGVLLGKHPMAPSVSPSKTWEGLLGSLTWTAIGSAVLLHFAFHTEYWQGAIFGLGVSAAAVLGDLTESLLKREFKIKDMSGLLPGHGGVMDRLDSIVLAAPVAYAVLAIFAPPGV